MVLGIDTAARLTAAQAKALKAAGYDFAGRYLVPSGSKALTKAEAETITAAGLNILTVWETTAGRAKGGAAAGAEDGAQALACAKQIGMPTSGVIYFAVDFDAQGSDMDAIEAYLRAAKAMTGDYPIGVYGSYSVVETMAQHQVCEHFWQCIAWSYGKKSAYRDVYQDQWNQSVAGVWVDIDECADMAAAGMWNYEEETMSGEEIYNSLMAYLGSLSLPDWAEKELAEAEALGITDGSSPMLFTPRYQAAIMAKRAVEKLKEEK